MTLTCITYLILQHVNHQHEVCAGTSLRVRAHFAIEFEFVFVVDPQRTRRCALAMIGRRDTCFQPITIGFV